MSRTSHIIRLVPRNSSANDSVTTSKSSSDAIAARSLSDKASLLRPLKDEHLLEVYREAKKMNLSAEFIELLEDAIELRQLEHRLKA
ncbi:MULTISPECIES: sporulation histidine kinase inhibitor Sda [Cohnella]|uniref:sporulation histidine kinase inhibitor Sda n=1 Tax=Cohnella TaxID=329857 RepID=UPI0009BBB76D|nr:MULTISPECIES: sporulation histidine kinase inhibitor Sda [Cohnella]MBN2981497.1 sporulation histidine kinase inhibitor Sda [Cohnella algarum]